MATLRIPVSEADHAQGPADAPVTLVEYGDYQCPYCGAAYPLVQRLQRRFGNELRFVFRNFPLAQMHPEAVSAALTAEFGAAHARFWEIHDALYEKQKELGAALYESIVTELGLDVDDLRSALEAEEYGDKIRADFNGGVRSGVNGTPTFFVNGARYDGPPDFASLEGALERAIHAGNGTKPSASTRR
jgi:protein-disulfide isomerase